MTLRGAGVLATILQAAQGSNYDYLVGNEVASALVDDPRLPVVSFTGSEGVGLAIQAAVPHKHVTLELGGNAAAVVCPDWASDADLEWAATRIATFAARRAGSSRAPRRNGQPDPAGARLSSGSLCFGR